MNNWQLDLMTDLSRTTSMQDILDISQKSVRGLGFDFCAWQSQLPLPLTKRRSFGISTTDDKAHSKGRAGGYDESPAMKHCAKSTTPFTWLGTTDDEVFHQAPTLFEEYYSFGHRGGWAQSIIDSYGLYSVFVADSANPFEQQDLDNVDLHLQWIATAVHSSMLRTRDIEKRVSLTVRETEILRWTGDGKTAEEIGIILNLNHNTINFHLRNAMQKLEATNKTAAVVKAIFLRLL